MTFKQHIRHASDSQLRGIYEFFNAPDLRRYYTGLLEDIQCELILRGEHDEPAPDAAPESEATDAPKSNR